MESSEWLGVEGESIRRAVAASAPCAGGGAAAALPYLRNKGRLPGPTFVVPFLGSALYRQPALARASGLGLSADFLVGRFIVFVRSTELSHKVFANVRHDAVLLIGHPFGKKLFGDHNLIYMLDQQHEDLRCRVAPNFTPRAHCAYVAIQQHVIISHFRKCLDLASASNAQPIALRLPCRDLNLETS